MKKNKKLFAILTLVAFMITLMPVMAFATYAGPDAGTVFNGEPKVLIKADGTKVDVEIDVTNGVATDKVALVKLASDGVTFSADEVTAAAINASTGRHTLRLTGAATAPKKDDKYAVVLSSANGAMSGTEKLGTDVAVKDYKIVTINDDHVAVAAAVVKYAADATALDTAQAYKALNAGQKTLFADSLADAGKVAALNATYETTIATDTLAKFDLALVNNSTLALVNAFTVLYKDTDKATFAQVAGTEKAALAAKIYAAGSDVDKVNIAKAGATAISLGNLIANPSAAIAGFVADYAVVIADPAIKAQFEAIVGADKAALAAQINAHRTDAALVTSIIKAFNNGGTDPSQPGLSTLPASSTASKIYSVDTLATVKGNEYLEFDVQLKDASNIDTKTLPANTKLLVWAERTKDILSDVDKINGQVGYQMVTTPKGASTSFSVKSDVAGKVTIKAAIVPDTYATDTFAAVAGAIANGTTNSLTGSFAGEFESDATGIKAMNVVSVALNGGVITADANKNYTGATANSLDKYTVTLQVVDKDNQGLAGKKVTIAANKTGVSFNKTEATTDSRGQVKFDVTSEKKAGKTNPFVLTAVCGNQSQDLNVLFEANTAVNLKMVKSPAGPVAVDSEFSVKVSALDSNNNKVTDTTNSTYSTADCVAKLGDKEYLMTPDGADSNGDVKFVFTPEKVGTYEVKITLANGKNVKASVDVKEQGKVTKMELNYDADTVNIGASTTKPEVIEFDADGVQRTVSNAVVNFAADGKGLKDVSTNGVVSISNDDKFAGNKITVTAVDRIKGVSATATLTIAADAEGLAFASKVGQVGIDNNIQFSVVDSAGNKVALGDNVDLGNITAVVIEKPEGANATAVINKENDLKNKGVALLTVASNKEGTVKVQVMVPVTYTDDNNKLIKKFYTGVAEIAMGKEAVQPASVVTMFMGSTEYMVNGVSKSMEVAPFIKDNRTFLPLRTFGEAIGADVNYDADTKVITVTKAGKTLTLTIGSNVITTSDGKTITSDVAPFIVGEGTTVLQLRVVAEYFGYAVEAIAAADGSTAAVVFTAK